MKGTLNITYFKTTYSKLMVLLVLLLLQSCGGSSNDTPIYSIAADVDNASFSNEFLNESTESITIKVTFDGDGLLVGFASETEDSRWLSYRSDNVTATSATIYIDVINGERLPADLYKTKLRLSTTNTDGSIFASHDIDVSLLVWDMALDTEQVNFSATLGDTSTANQTIEITSNNDWTVTTDESWLSVDVESGSGNAIINVIASTTQSTESGLTNGNIIFTELTSGDSKSIPAQLALDKLYLYADSQTVALTKTTNITATTKTIAISSNSETDITWQASTTVEWLTLTPLADSQLKITANPDLAPINETSTALITISATDNTSVAIDNINVGFYHSDLTVENKLIEPLAITSTMLASPTLPEFYLAKGNKLFTYHQYTAVMLNTLLVSPEGTELEQLIMNPNGEYLLAKTIETITNDDNSTSEVIHRYRINLLDDSIEEIETATIVYEPLAIVRLSGRNFILTEALEFADEELKLLYWDGENAYFTNNVDMATNANTLFSLDILNATIKRYTAQVNDFGENRILPELTHSYRPESLSETQLINDFIVTNDEGNIYAISETSEWISFDGTTFTDNGLLESNENVVNLFLVESQDENNISNVNYLKIDPTQPDGFYLATYDEQQNLSRTIFTDGNQPSSILLSADNQRLMINTNTPSTPETDARIELITLEP